MTYANLFPKRVRALVVDGVLDPVAWATGRGAESFLVPFSTRLRSDAGAMATLREFFRLCDAGGPRCAFSGGAAARFAALARKLREQPVEIVFDDGTTETFDYTVLIGMTLGALYDPFIWPDLAGLLAELEAAASGSLRAAAPVKRLDVERGRATRRRLHARRGGGIELEYLNFLEAFPGVACADSVNPRSYVAWSVNGALADAQFGYFGRTWTWASSICAEWPGADRDRYLGPFTGHDVEPGVVVGNRFDPATRYEGAVVVDQLLPRSALLTLEGWGHTSLFLSACVDETVARYLLTGATPAPGTHRAARTWCPSRADALDAPLVAVEEAAGALEAARLQVGGRDQELDAPEALDREAEPLVVAEREEMAPGVARDARRAASTGCRRPEPRCTRARGAGGTAGPRGGRGRRSRRTSLQLDRVQRRHQAVAREARVREVGPDVEARERPAAGAGRGAGSTARRSGVPGRACTTVVHSPLNGWFQLPSTRSMWAKNSIVPSCPLSSAASAGRSRSRSWPRKVWA